jgi:hypothetical protein
MLKHQYEVTPVSFAVGLLWIGVSYLLGNHWFFSRLSLLLAILGFVPAGLVVLTHFRELGPFMWWDSSNRVLTTQRSPGVEKIELATMTVLWTLRGLLARPIGTRLKSLIALQFYVIQRCRFSAIRHALNFHHITRFEFDI